MRKYTRNRILAESKSQRFYEDSPCETCGMTAYYTSLGACVECSRRAAKQRYLTNRPPKMLLVNARGQIAREFRRERDRCIQANKSLKEKDQIRPFTRSLSTATATNMVIALKRGRGKHCAYCGSGDGLVLDVINYDLKPTWLRADNLHLLCAAHKREKFASGLSDQAYRRSAGIPPATEWDVL